MTDQLQTIGSGCMCHECPKLHKVTELQALRCPSIKLQLCHQGVCHGCIYRISIACCCSSLWRQRHQGTRWQVTGWQSGSACKNLYTCSYCSYSELQQLRHSWPMADFSWAVCQAHQAHPSPRLPCGLLLQRPAQVDIFTSCKRKALQQSQT